MKVETEVGKGGGGVGEGERVVEFGVTLKMRQPTPVHLIWEDR